ncbi:MAG: hypothetical protein CBARDCOR_3831 [uncultured Caballeronia sp.]|nr:MAG: hypothetical protein CBARDCOR_3831 [uncultured Caballeronia sp.]
MTAALHWISRPLTKTLRARHPNASAPRPRRDQQQLYRRDPRYVVNVALGSIADGRWSIDRRGGILIHTFGWRSIFLANLLIGLWLKC